MARQVLIIKYYLQYQMATKDGKRMETMPLRSTRRTKYEQLREANNHEALNQLSLDEQKVHHIHIEDPKQQQNSPKNEKQSTSPPNNDPQIIPLLEDKARRVTRSTAPITRKICSEAYLPDETLNQEGNLFRKVSEQPTLKKVAKEESAKCLSENGCLDLPATVKRSIAKHAENILSPYNQVRKSYRRIHKSEIVSIPYRKCHDAFEGRIVSIINKIQSGKNCLRDFQSLLQRMQRINGKDMMNRYIIAGISTIIKLSREKGIYDLKIIQRLETQEKKLKSKIIQEMDKVDDFNHCLLNQNQQIIDSREYKKMIIRKCYKIMKSQRKKHNIHSGGHGELRETVFRDCQKLFSSEAKVGSLIKFIKQKMSNVQQ